MNSTTSKVISALLIGVVTVILYKVFRKWLRSLAAPKKQTDSEKISKESPSESDDYSSGEIVHVKKQVCDRKHHRQFRYCDDLLDKTVLDKMVLDNLITKCILMIEDREEIIKPTTQSERNRVLLDILTERPYGTLDVFIGVLNDSDQINEDVQEIVSRIECTKNSDETISCHDIIFHEHIVQLQKNYMMLVHDVDCRTDIADYLYANDVLNTEEKEEISNSSLTKQDSNRILCDKFFRKGKDAYRHLIEALRHGEYYEVASNMVDTKVSDQEIELCTRGMKKLRERQRKKEDLTRIHDEVIPTHILECFPEDPSNVECIEGEDATMTCKVRPGSQPVRWMKDGNEIRQNEKCKMYNEDTQYIIQLRNTTTSDSGEYLVQVGQFSRKIHLTIIDCFPEDPFNVECVEGEDAIMTCKVRPGSQPVKWMKDGYEIRQNENCKMYNEDTQYSLKLRNTITSDNGQYVVQVGQLSRKLHLRIIGIPGEITKGERKTYMDAIQSGTEVRKYVRIQVIGKDRVGKTSLVHRLLGYKKHDGKSTDGIAIDRKCLIRESDGEWIVGDVATERKKNERIITILQGDNIKRKGTKPVSDTPLISDEHVLDTKKKLNKKEPNKIEEDNLLQKEKQKHKTIPVGEYQYRRETGMEKISTKKEKDETESLKFHEELKKTDVTNVTKDIPAASKNNSDKSKSNIADRFSSSEEKQSITKKPKEKQMKNSEQKPGPSILSPQNQNPINSDEADKLTGETNEKMDKILLRAKNKKEKMTLNGLVESGIWDFAGQKDYYATHQTFFTPHAIYLLVADIEDAITGTEGDENVNFDTIGDYIDFWFDSIHCFCSDPSAGKLCPHVIMVCTGTDKVPEIEKKKAEYDATFIRMFGPQKKADHSRGIHFISNIVPRKDEIERLKKHISKLAKEMNYFAEELPTRWINLEIALDVLKDLNETVSSWKDIKKLALAYLIEEKELLLFLNYQHKIGNIIFFESERDFIILQPNWLVKCFRCLVCDDKKHFVAGLVSEMFKLTHEGELSENLIDELFKKEPDLKFGQYKHHILNVMEKFDIIVKPNISNTSKNSYYMPCMIKNSSPLQAIMENNFAFENPYRSPWLVLEFKFLPFAYFNHILFTYIRNYKVCKVNSANPQGDEHPAIYPEKALVYLDNTESRLLIICFSKNAISLQIYSAQQPIDSADNNKTYELILKTLCKRIAKLQIKLMHKLTYEIKAKCSTGNYKIRAGRMSYEELTTRRNEGKYLCKEDNQFHSSEAIENTWLKYKDVKDVETACVQLEIKIDELVAKGIHILSMKEVEELNEISRVFILSPDQLRDFLNFQHSLGKIVYFDVPQLRYYVIINSFLLGEVKKSFVTDVEFLPKEDKTRKTFKKLSENGMLRRKDLYQIWEQKKFRQILPFKEYIFDILIHLDVVYEHRRYDTKTESRLPVEYFFVPSMLTQRNDTDYLTEECTPERTVSLAFVFKGTSIPPALPNRLICTCLSMWTLNQYRGRKLIFSGFVGLSFDKEHDIVVCVEGNKILVYIVHNRSKGLIIPDIATSVKDCLFITLERISELYQSSINCKASSKLPFHIEYSCSKLSCFTPENKIASETEECLCEHGENIKNNWSIWNQKEEQKQCDSYCPGLSEDALSQIPSDTELLRLSVNLETSMLHELAHYLGMEEMEWNNIIDNFPTNSLMVKFLTLIHLKKCYGNISFADLNDGLRTMNITTHKLCVVRRRKQVKSSIPDDILDCIPSDEILHRLAPLIGRIVFQLGIELGLSVEEIECISEKCDRDLPSQNKEVLFTWMKDRTLKPTLRVLEQAFVNIGKGARCLKAVLKDIDPNTLKAIEIVTDRIRGNENRIIQDIQISQILDHMITHLVITVDDRRYIDHYPRKDDQNKALLDIVIKRREPAYSVFIDGLRNYGYEDIANDLKFDSQEMSPRTALLSAENEGLSVWNVPWYKIRLQKNYLKIITDIQHKSIVDHLMTREVVSVDDWEKIEFGKTRQEKNRNLMEILLHNNERGFNEFLKALRKDPMYADLADQIEKTEVTSRDIAILHTCFK